MALAKKTSLWRFKKGDTTPMYGNQKDLEPLILDLPESLFQKLGLHFDSLPNHLASSFRLFTPLKGKTRVYTDSNKEDAGDDYKVDQIILKMDFSTINKNEDETLDRGLWNQQGKIKPQIVSKYDQQATAVRDCELLEKVQNILVANKAEQVIEVDLNPSTGTSDFTIDSDSKAFGLFEKAHTILNRIFRIEDKAGIEKLENVVVLISPEFKLAYDLAIAWKSINPSVLLNDFVERMAGKKMHVTRYLGGTYSDGYIIEGKAYDFSKLHLVAGVKCKYGFKACPSIRGMRHFFTNTIPRSDNQVTGMKHQSGIGAWPIFKNRIFAIMAK